MGNLAEISINKYAADNGMQNEIGGLIRILRITMNGVQWLQNKPQAQLLKLENSYKDFVSGKIPVNFTSRENKEKFELMVRKDYPQLFWYTIVLLTFYINIILHLFQSSSH